MSKRLIFASCGQSTASERALGESLKATIDATTGFRAYFAQTVQSLEGLSHSVLKALRTCAGAVVVLNDRGPLLDIEAREHGRRSSVWVNQEVAILAYRQFQEGVPLPILCFKDAAVTIEGAMTAFIVNPRVPSGPEAVLDAVETWLRTTWFQAGSRTVFEAKWEQLSDATRQVLAVLIEEGGNRVLMSTLRGALIDRHSKSSKDAFDDVARASTEGVRGVPPIVITRHGGRLFEVVRA